MFQKAVVRHIITSYTYPLPHLIHTSNTDQRFSEKMVSPPKTPKKSVKPRKKRKRKPLKKYRCPLGCSIQVTGMSNLRRHIRELHNNIPEKEKLKVLKRAYAKGPRNDAWVAEMNEADSDEPTAKKARSTTIEKDQFVMFYAGGMES
jgi:hypothetical protein